MPSSTRSSKKTQSTSDRPVDPINPQTGTGPFAGVFRAPNDHRFCSDRPSAYEVNKAVAGLRRFQSSKNFRALLSEYEAVPDQDKLHVILNTFDGATMRARGIPFPEGLQTFVSINASGGKEDDDEEGIEICGYAGIGGVTWGLFMPTQCFRVNIDVDVEPADDDEDSDE